MLPGRSQLRSRKLTLTNPQLLRDASGPSCSEGAGGGRPQRPGLPVALCAFLEVFPRGNSLSKTAGCHWLCRNHPARSGTITFRCNHCYRVWCAGQQKIPPHLCETCGRSNFPVEGGGKIRTNLGREFTRCSTGHWPLATDHWPLVTVPLITDHRPIRSEFPRTPPVHRLP